VKSWPLQPSGDPSTCEVQRRTTLLPRNPEFEPIRGSGASDDIRLVAEFVEVLAGLDADEPQRGAILKRRVNSRPLIEPVM
jgi:hypothetical protein